MRDGARRPSRRSRKRGWMHEEGPKRRHSMRDGARRPCRRSKRRRGRAGRAAALRRAPRGGTGERRMAAQSPRQDRQCGEGEHRHQQGLHRGRGSRDAPTGPQGGALEGTVSVELAAAAAGVERGPRCDGAIVTG